MYARYDERILKKEESFSDGHVVQYDVMVDNSTVVGESYYALNLDFCTNCEKYPTMWNFRMVLRPVKASEIVSIPVSLTRRDSVTCEVNASIDVSLCSRGEILRGIPRDFVKHGMESGDEFRGYIYRLPRPPFDIILFNDMVDIRVIVVIRECHKPQVGGSPPPAPPPSPTLSTSSASSASSTSSAISALSAISILSASPTPPATGLKNAFARKMKKILEKRK
ncbi:unnamed protein product [Larinioides sclopetarius]|uniref:Uncharacterized protein n=1 Tax=Larinioides sclopetarius TaxID=280406 RepID=A0AAV1YRZ0_9ARAC